MGIMPYRLITITTGVMLIQYILAAVIGARFDAEGDFVREAPDSPEKMQVLRTLESTTTIVAAQVLFGTGNSETTLARLDPLWAWLFDNRARLLQADGEGYYHRGQLLLNA